MAASHFGQIPATFRQKIRINQLFDQPVVDISCLFTEIDSDFYDFSRIHGEEGD